MRILVAGAIGRRLVPMLLDAGHHVTGLTRSPARAAELRGLGACAVVVDALDREAAIANVRGARPEVVVHQIRLRKEETDNLRAAAWEAGARRIVALVHVDAAAVAAIERGATGGSLQRKGRGRVERRRQAWLPLGSDGTAWGAGR
jgi:nucleoside-diphosphate-sugar epimerase